jgi:hypothetical protein
MNRKDRNVLLDYAQTQAFPAHRFREGYLSQARSAYKFLVEMRYAKLYGWWRTLTDTQKNEWRSFIRVYFHISDERMQTESIHTILEFSQAFANDEREGVAYVDLESGHLRDAWVELRNEVWWKFKSMVII